MVRLDRGGREDDIRSLVGDDEQRLARTDETELTPRQLLDRPRLLAQLSHVLPEPFVLCLQDCDYLREVLELVRCTDHRDEAALSDDRVANENDRNQDDEEAGRSTPCGSTPRHNRRGVGVCR